MPDVIAADPARLPQSLLARFARVRGVGFGAFSRLFALGAQFLILALLSKLLAKRDFGDFMIAFALMRVLSQGLGTGLATLLVYHISRNATPAREMALHRTVVLVGLVVGGAATIALAAGGPAIAAFFAKPSLAFWLRGLAPFMLFSMLLTVSTGAYDGRGRITRSIVFSEFVPNTIRLAMLPALLIAGFGNTAVVWVMGASALLPWLVIAGGLLRRPQGGLARLTRWDAGYASKLTLHSFAAMQVQGIDMLVVGWLFSSTTAADYAIASRVAALIPFFQQIIVKGFMAKAGRAMHEANWPGLQGEIDRSRLACTLLVIGTAAAAMLAYPLLLVFLPGFGGSMPILAALTLSPIVRSYFPGGDALLRIAGFAQTSLNIMLCSMLFVIITPLVLANWLGIFALPLGMSLSALILNPMIDAVIRRHLHVRLNKGSDYIRIAVAAAGVLVCVFALQITSWIAGVIIMSLSVFGIKASIITIRSN